MIKSNIKLTNIFFIIIFILFGNKLFSQVTLGEIEKVEVTEVLKPPVYDSLKNFEAFNVRMTQYDTTYPPNEQLFYKQYIGLNLYIPPFSNPQIGTCSNNSYFLFSTTPSILLVDTTKLKIREQIYSRTPIVVDLGNGTSSTSYCQKFEYYKIMTLIYKPFHCNTVNSKAIVINSKEISDKYYTIIDVLCGDTLYKTWNNLRKKIWNAYDDKSIKNEKIYVDLQVYKSGSLPELIFILKNDINGDTLYYVNPSPYNKDFILVPFFVKQKQLYNGKTFLAYNENVNYSYEQKTIDAATGKEFVYIVNKEPFLSKWTCEVNLLNINFRGIEMNYYFMYYILKNSDGKIILRENFNGLEDSKFILEETYLKQEEEKKLKQEELIAKKKKELEIKEENERTAKEKRLQECINKFGQNKGVIIAQGKVTIGMTEEMCKLSWGTPFWKNKTTTEYGVYEDWYYGFGYSLHFVNGSLKRFQE